MNILNALLFTALLTVNAWAQPPLMLKLREGDVSAGPEVETKGGGVANISVPEIAVHLPDPATATGMAFIVCPGGSYREVGAFSDGMGTVPYFVPKGAAVVVLKYRTKPPSTDVVTAALADAKRAVRLVRHHAKDWAIDPQKIVMIGSSAGSHLTLNLATHADAGNPAAEDPVERESCLPNYTVLLCPWPNKQTVDQFPINREMPPSFVACAKDDQIAPIAFAESIVEACKKAGVPSELWAVENGGHTAFKQARNPASLWPDRIVAWLKEKGVWKN
jgi:acetyl esterase/lipase